MGATSCLIAVFFAPLRLSLRLSLTFDNSGLLFSVILIEF